MPHDRRHCCEWAALNFLIVHSETIGIEVSEARYGELYDVTRYLAARAV